jgi:hypothetical protein
VLWKNCTTKGAVIGGFLGLISAVVMTVLSDSVWVATLGNPKARSVPLHLAGPVLHDHRLRGYLDLLAARPQPELPSRNVPTSPPS